MNLLGGLGELAALFARPVRRGMGVYEGAPPDPATDPAGFNRCMAVLRDAVYNIFPFQAAVMKSLLSSQRRSPRKLSSSQLTESARIAYAAMGRDCSSIVDAIQGRPSGAVAERLGYARVAIGTNLQTSRQFYAKASRAARVALKSSEGVASQQGLKSTWNLLARVSNARTGENRVMHPLARDPAAAIHPAKMFVAFARYYPADYTAAAIDGMEARFTACFGAGPVPHFSDANQWSEPDLVSVSSPSLSPTPVASPPPPVAVECPPGTVYVESLRYGWVACSDGQTASVSRGSGCEKPSNLNAMCSSQGHGGWPGYSRGRARSRLHGMDGQTQFDRTLGGLL